MPRTVFALTLVLAAAAAHADPDKPGSRDYPLIQRFPHQFIRGFEEHDWDRRPFNLATGKQVVVEGHLLEIQYAMEKDAEKPSQLEFIRNYENALRAAGWTLEKQEGWNLTAHLDKNGREVWVRIEYSNGSASSRFIVVEKLPLPMIIAAGKPTPPTPGVRPDAMGKDYPGIPRLPGQRISAYDEKKFDFYQFAWADGSRHRQEGKKIVIRYEMEKGQKVPSAPQVVENYRAVLAAEGWTLLRADTFSVTAVLRDRDRETWAYVEHNTGSGNGSVVVVEPGELKQVVTASSLLDRLHTEGRVTFEVHFDTNQDVVKPESKPVVAQMVEVLKGDPAIKVEVQGHTDTVGNEKDNLSLSDRRAKSVMALLVAGGIEAARLTARGYGPSRPIADNASESGRALNRRVELVRR